MPTTLVKGCPYCHDVEIRMLSSRVGFSGPWSTRRVVRCRCGTVDRTVARYPFLAGEVARATPEEIAAASYVPPSRPLRRVPPEATRPPTLAEQFVGKVSAAMWWCGDYVCDCTEPQITLYEPNQVRGFRVTTLWSGTFHSEATREEADAQQRELEVECERRGIKLGLNRLSDLDRDRLLGGLVA